MSTHQDLIPEPHSRTFKRIAKDHPGKTFYIDLYRGSHKIFVQESPMNTPEAPSDKQQRSAFARS